VPYQSIARTPLGLAQLLATGILDNPNACLVSPVVVGRADELAALKQAIPVP